MPRIKCRTPSTGRSLRISLANVSTNYITIVETPDFSVPDVARNFPVRDTTDPTRAIKPGEVFFLTPLAARNKTANTSWIETSLFTEDNVRVELSKVDVPAGDTVFIPIQGRSLFKRDANTANGDIVQVRAETANTFDIWIAAEEKLSSEHIGVIND
jgi:hypothetical protein